MKKILCLSVLGLVMFIFINAGKNDDGSSVSFKTTNSHPSSTGAPGELTCSRSGCHNGPVFDGTGINLISFGNNDTGYIPGTVYNMKVSVTNGITQKFGFQIVALKDADSTSIGTFIITNSSKTQLQNGDAAFNLQSRKYVTLNLREHKLQHRDLLSGPLIGRPLLLMKGISLSTLPHR